jgi:hypothetical protein
MCSGTKTTSPAGLLFLWIGGCAGPADTTTTPPPLDTDTSAVVLPPTTLPLEGCQWFRTVSVDIGGQALHVTVDSGSGTLAVSSVGCDACSAVGVADLYDSSGAEDAGHSATGVYDVGELEWSGEVVQDSVEFEGVDPVDLRLVAVSDQTGMFGAARCTDADGSVTDLTIDGIFGIGADFSAVRYTDAYLATRADDYHADESYTLHTCPVGGSLRIGGYDDALATGDLQLATLGDDYGDMAPVMAIEVTGESGVPTVAPLAAGGDSLPALLDSGGPNLIIPADAWDAVTAVIEADPDFAQLGGPAFWTEGAAVAMTPAELDAVLPALTIDIEADPPIALTLPATESYVTWSSAEGGTFQYFRSLYSDAELGPGYEEFVDLGNRVMTSYVVYVDRTEGTVGFAPAVGCQ